MKLEFYILGGSIMDILGTIEDAMIKINKKSQGEIYGNYDPAFQQQMRNLEMKRKNEKMANKSAEYTEKKKQEMELQRQEMVQRRTEESENGISAGTAVAGVAATAVIGGLGYLAKKFLIDDKKK